MDSFSGGSLNGVDSFAENPIMYRLIWVFLWRIQDLVGVVREGGGGGGGAKF